RSFLKTSGIALLAGTLAYPMGMASASASSVKSTLKVGLVGCGGRGTGAAAQAIRADENVVITAMGDVFEDRLEESYASLLKVGEKQVKVDKKKKFVGFD